MTFRSLWPTLCLMAALASLAPNSRAAAPDTPGDHAPSRLLSIKSLQNGAAFPGQLFLPPSPLGPAPLVVFVPGTDGLDERQDFYRPALLSRGIAILEIDTKTGVFTSTANRLSADFYMPVVFGALLALRAMPEIDPRRIAIMGWSFGGGISKRAANGRDRRQWLPSGQNGFAAHVVLYGGCGRVNDLANVPMLILVGDKDSYGASRGCLEFAREHRQVSLKIYPDAQHGFDRPTDKKVRGGRVMEWQEDAALDARDRVVEFLTRTLAR